MQECAKFDPHYYNPTDKSCYYNGSPNDCRYFVNQKCYPYVDSSYTAATCANIGGFFTTFSTEGGSGNFCYYKQFNCTFQSVNQQCYRFKTPVNTVAECDSNHGYYKHGYCYHQCPDNKFLNNGQCHGIRSAQYTQSDCEDVGGHYQQKYCFLKGCNYTMINNKCYKYRSLNYSNGTCINIGGYYTAEVTYPYTPYCYYTSFNCCCHKINGQCYSRSSDHSQTLCQTIPDSYFDVSNNTCYYYCTEMPKLRQCFAANSPSFTRETCAIIGGIYYQGTCYYITSCTMHKGNNGQCYTNRSDALTCSTCRNIGGHYENGFCYYYQYNCTAYSIDGQCYSSRYFTFSASPCAFRGGTLVRGYCYHSAPSNCRYLYRNCLCFQHQSASKTAGTCANIGGYYDFRLGKCFYNSDSCPYYPKNSQCYKYRKANVTRSECALIDEHVTHIMDELGDQLCYFNNVNCTYWINNKCYFRFSASYNKATCDSLRGYYSQAGEGCYFNSSTCRYFIAGRCYDKVYSGWSKTQCDEANGYFYRPHFCYISNYYCPYLVASRRKCHLYTSASFDCSSCQLLGGHYFQSGSCYYSKHCSEPLLLASNGQCYGNQTTARTAAECRSMPGNSFYDSRNAKCYFTTGLCSGRYVNCQCFIHSSTVYTSGSCSNFGGQYFDDTCYYNSSYCPYHVVNGQCYRHFEVYNSQQLCENIGGHYVFAPVPSIIFTLPPPPPPVLGSTSYEGTVSRPSPPVPTPTPTAPRPTALPVIISSARPSLTTSGFYRMTTTLSRPVRLCYYNSFSCSGFRVVSRYCYTHRSEAYNIQTCSNIGGMYGYPLYARTYQPTEHDEQYPGRTYSCLYNAFNCAG